MFDEAVKSCGKKFAEKLTGNLKNIAKSKIEAKLNELTVQLKR
jgi:hypothetical protein